MRQRNGLGSGMIQSTQGLGGGGHGTTKGGYLLPSLIRRVSVAPNSTAVGLEVEQVGWLRACWMQKCPEVGIWCNAKSNLGSQGGLR